MDAGAVRSRLRRRAPREPAPRRLGTRRRREQVVRQQRVGIDRPSAARTSGADGLSRRRRSTKASTSAASARSVLVSTRPVGDRGLLHALRPPVELGEAVHRVDGGDDVAPAGNDGAAPDRPARSTGWGTDRRAPCSRPPAGGTRGTSPRSRRPVQVADRRRKLAANGAAQAARRQQHHRVVDAVQQVMIEPDLAELVDQHGRIGQRGSAQQPLQQRRLARAQEARDQVDRREGRAPSTMCRCLPDARSGRGSSGSQGRPTKLLGGGPEMGEVVDQLGLAGGRRQEERRALPVGERQAVEA